jgi:DNA-binding HxlR family transcriptional regulator
VVFDRGFKRPSEMHREIRSATPRVIDMQLRELETHGVVTKIVSTRFPLHAEYSLTELGRSILPIIALMNSWGDTNRYFFER